MAQRCSDTQCRYEDSVDILILSYFFVSYFHTGKLCLYLVHSQIK